MRSKALARAVVVVALFIAAFLGVTVARAQEPAGSERASAREHFERGIELFEEEAWDAALAEFQRSRALFPTRAATKNAAFCLKRLHRYDEALEAFESLERDVPTARSADDLELAKREIAALEKLVGRVDVRGAPTGATLMIDERQRGALPSSPRVSAGTHVVRVQRDGYLPFEARVEVAGEQIVVVAARLVPLARSGRLSIAESDGLALDVVVDGFVVGRSPWEGAVAPGPHVVALAGESEMGTEPKAVVVVLDELTSLSLRAGKLDAFVRVELEPRSGSIAIDRVTVGRGVWEGRLTSGRHAIEASAEGFLTRAEAVVLEPGRRAPIRIALERDRASPVWAAEPVPHVVVHARTFLMFAPVFGGQVVEGCASCGSLGTGFSVLAGGSYELPSGLGIGLEAGYSALTASVTGRATEARLPSPHAESTDDKISLRGALLGVVASFHRGKRVTWGIKAHVGALLGSARDERGGRFANVAPGPAGTTYDVSVASSSAATYLVMALEARVGFRLSSRFEVGAGIAPMVLRALRQPRWQREATFAAGRDGEGTFPDETMVGATVVAICPGLDARYEF